MWGGQPGTPVSSSQHYLCPFLVCSMTVLLECQEEVISAQCFKNLKQFINSERKSSSIYVPSNTNSSLRVQQITTQGGNIICQRTRGSSSAVSIQVTEIRITSAEASPTAASTELANPQLEPAAPPGSRDSFPSQRGRTASRSQVLQADFIEI